jgi:hypothetical protein
VRVGSAQDTIELDDLPPVVSSHVEPGNERRQSLLDGNRPGRARRASRRRQRFCDLIGIPKVAILVFEQDEVSSLVKRVARRES